MPDVCLRLAGRLPAGDSSTAAVQGFGWGGWRMRKDGVHRRCMQYMVSRQGMRGAYRNHTANI
jgi:hypothetical protein